MQTPGPGWLEKALSNEIQVNISEYPLDNDFSGGKFYPAMNKCKHKKSQNFELDDGVLNRTEEKYLFKGEKKKLGGWREGERE